MSSCSPATFLTAARYEERGLCFCDVFILFWYFIFFPLLKMRCDSRIFAEIPEAFYRWRKKKSEIEKFIEYKIEEEKQKRKKSGKEIKVDWRMCRTFGIDISILFPLPEPAGAVVCPLIFSLWWFFFFPPRYFLLIQLLFERVEEVGNFRLWITN